MNAISVENRPIIFPKYTGMLIMNGVEVGIVGKRETDMKLTSLVYNAILNDRVEELPDIAIYNVIDKTWECIYVNDDDRVTLRNKSNAIVDYVKVREWTKQVLNAVMNFVVQFSAASLTA